MSDSPPVQVEVSRVFKRNLRRLAKKYRNIRSDLQPVIEPLEQGDLPGDQIPDLGYTVFKLRVPEEKFGVAGVAVSDGMVLWQLEFVPAGEFWPVTLAVGSQP